MKKLLLFTMALIFSASMFSQRSSNDNPRYWNLWQYKVKADKNQEFMDAAAKKTARFNGTPETAMATYRVATGRNTGTYVRISGPMKASDFDVDRSAEGKYWMENVAKYVGQDFGAIRWQQLNDGTMNFTPGEGSPAKYIEQTYYDVKPGKVDHFRRFQSRIVENWKKRNVPIRRGLFRLVSGGNTNLFVAANFFDTYKREANPSTENNWEDDYNELFGRGSWDEDLENFQSSFENWGVLKETLQLVPEMTTGMMK